MKKKYIILSFLLIIFNLVKSQEIKEIVSFSYRTSFDGVLWYIIKAEVKSQNDSVYYIKDRIMRDAPNTEIIFPFTYLISNDTFIGKRCYNKYGLQNCQVDSVILYTPIKYFSDSTNPLLRDTLSILDYSFILQKAAEPKIYNKQFSYNLIRFLIIDTDSAIIYRIEKNGSNVAVIKKTILLGDENLKVIENRTIQVNKKVFDKLLKYLKEGKYWQMDTITRVGIRNILIESYIDNNYYFVNKNETEIKWYNKEILKCFKTLNKL